VLKTSSKRLYKNLPGSNLID